MGWRGSGERQRRRCCWAHGSIWKGRSSVEGSAWASGSDSDPEPEKLAAESTSGSKSESEPPCVSAS
eukprot:1434878-Rhodomonas_salina.1